MIARTIKNLFRALITTLPADQLLRVGFCVHHRRPLFGSPCPSWTPVSKGFLGVSAVITGTVLPKQNSGQTPAAPVSARPTTGPPSAASSSAAPHRNKK